MLRLLLKIEIRKQYNFSSKELQEVKSVVGESPFFNKNKSLKVSIEQLDLLLSGSIDLNCFSTSRAINGYSVGTESVFEDFERISFLGEIRHLVRKSVKQTIFFNVRRLNLKTITPKLSELRISVADFG